MVGDAAVLKAYSGIVRTHDGSLSGVAFARGASSPSDDGVSIDRWLGVLVANLAPAPPSVRTSNGDRMGLGSERVYRSIHDQPDSRCARGNTIDQHQSI